MASIWRHAAVPQGKFSTHREHIASEKISPIERGTDWLLQKVGHIGPKTREWSQGLVANRGVQAVRVLHGLLNLIDKHPSSVIEQACELAHAGGSYRLATIRKLIQHCGAKQGQFEFLEEHPIIRNLSEYGDIVRVDFRKEAYQP